MREVRVAHVFPELVLGGADRAVLDLVRHLPAHGYECDLYVLRDRGRFPRPDLVPRGLVDLGQEGPVTRLRSVARSSRRLRERMRASGAALIHTHLWPADVVGAVANLGLGLPHVSHQQGTGPELLRASLKPRLKRALTRGLMRRSGARFLAVSEDVRRYTSELYGISTARIEVAYNAFDPAEFPPFERTLAPPDAPLAIGTAGRLAPEKGVELIIRAVAALRDAGAAARLRIAGEGALRESCQRLVHELDLHGRVELCGPLSDMAAFYRSIEVFTLPSLHSEGFSVSLVEAMATGCVPVASDVSGVREAIREGIDGYVVPPGDAGELAGRLRLLAGDPARRLAMSRSAQERARSAFSTDVLVARVAGIYDRLLRDRSRTGGRRA